MPVRFERDDGRRRVVVAVEGALQPDEVLGILAQRRTDGTVTYGTLCDLRSMTGRPTMGDLRHVVTESAARDAGQVRRGPLAILATDPDHYIMACAYAALRQPTRTVEVFRALDEAEQWLTAKRNEERR
jgi:hypothetical protein